MLVRRSFRKEVTVAAFVAAALSAAIGARAADLPVPCVAGTCGAAAVGFVTSGNASLVSSGNTMRIDQRSDKAILNWSSFDVASGNTVVFNQPGASSIALNRIHQASPSQIFGAIEANGQIYLVNQNGIVFGNGSRVRTAGLIASTLDISDQNFAAGLLAPELLGAGRAALESDGRTSVIDADGKPVLGADGKPLEVKLSVQQGAELTTRDANQRILLAGQKVENSGKITTPQGQTVLAAGEKVYLQASSDPNLRGLVVEVDKGGTAWNRLTGDISAAQGNVTLVGLTVNQDGRLSATTTVNANGSIRLQARDSVTITKPRDNYAIAAQHGGTLNIGTGSSTTVLPELADTATAVDDQPQAPSTVLLSGQQIFVQSGSQIIAPGGQVTVAARTNPSSLTTYDPEARVRVHSGAVIDVSGTHATAPVTRNLLTVELRANELADSPLQRDGVLRGQPLVVDARVGTPLGNIDGAIKTIARGIGERTSKGGTVSFASDGDVMVNDGALINVSGGSIDYLPGVIQTSMLMAADGRLYDVGTAPKDLVYKAIINPTSKVSYDRWGVTETVRGPSLGHYDPGYTEGRDGGTLSFAAPVMSLRGDILGSTITGILQRGPASAPAGSRFLIGDPTGSGLDIPDYRAPSISFVNSPTPLVVTDAAALRGAGTLELPVDFLKEGGFTRTEIYSNGTIDLALPDPLKLLPGSTFSLSAHRIDLRSDVIAPAGTVSLTSVRTVGITDLTLPDAGVTVGNGVTVDVRGTWTNDQLEVQKPNVTPGSLSSPVFKDAGHILLATNWTGGSLKLGDEVNLLASGGGWVQADGKISGGKGGEIALLGGMPGGTFEIGENTHLEAFGVNNAAGGTFRFEAARVEIGYGTDWTQPTQPRQPPISIAAANGEALAPQELVPTTLPVRLGSALFSEFGFANFVINASGAMASDDVSTALSILPNTQLTPRVRSLLLTDPHNTPSAASTAAFSSVYTPVDGTRAPVSMAFGVIEPRKPGSPLEDRIGLLDFGAGAGIYLDPGSTVRFSGAGGVRLAGEIVAPSGTISATVGSPSLDFDHAGFLPGVGLDVLSSARFDVSGTRVLEPNDTGLLTGSVLSGGTIELLADRGSVNVLAGAQLLANGATGLLDLPDLANPSAGYSRTLVGSAGGSIRVRAPESILLAGSMSAHAGVGSTAATPGGSLTVQLTRERGFTGGLSLGTYPTNDRVLQLTDGQKYFGSSAPNGFAALDVNKVVAGGFDSLTLEGGNRIEIDPTVSLHLARELRLDSRQVSVLADGHVDLSAAYVSFGRTLPSSTAPASSSGAGTLALSGDLIDITGDTAVSGVSSVLFASTGDIRFRGVENAGTSRGSLLSAGDITLRSQRLYPTTETTFSVVSAGGPSNTVRIEQVGSSPGVPLSVGGNLSITAKNIVQGGTLLAPFGKISLTATDTVTFAPGSVTSVSAGTQTMPFGTVVLGDWQYTVGGQFLSQTALPDRQVNVDASEVDMQAGSTIDLRGGGDLYAYEWLPGTGGSKDALAAGSSKLFAVLPSMRGQSGAYDPMEYAGAGIGAGDTVYLAGSSLLPEGVYPLLPARYALLPGAILVEARPEFSNMASSATAALSDGTTVVAGRRTFLNTGLGDGVYSGFAIRDGSYGRQLATYNDYKASTFFPARADRLELARAAIPADAAALSLKIGTKLDARGTVQTAGATGGRGAELDLAATKLEILGTGAAFDPEAVQVQASALERWNPSKLWLGARHSSDGTSMEVVSDSVRLGDGVSLVHDEIVVAAKEQILLDGGSRIASRATVSSRLNNPDFAKTITNIAVTGEGAKGAAVLAASDLSRLQVTRPTDGADPAVLGGIFVEPNATVASRSALLVDAPGGGRLGGNLDGVGASWDVASSRLSFTDTEQESGLSITPTVANSLGQAYNARLASSTTIDFFGSLTFGSGVQSGASLTDLTLVASAIRSMGDNNQVTIGAARNLTFEGTATDDLPQASGTGLLTAKATEITLGPGNLAIHGFAGLALDATGAVRSEGKGKLQVDGTLDIRTPMLAAAPSTDTATTIADLTLISSGATSIRSNGGTPIAVDAPALGGALSIQASSIDLSTKIVQPSGLVTLNASEGLTLGSGALIDVGGVPVVIQGREAMSPAGTIQLVSGGGLTADAGATLNVAAGQSTGGSLLVQSKGAAQFDATLRGGVGASFDLFAGSLTDFTRLNRALEAGGFSGQRDVRVASGDLVLGAGETITARSTSLTADGGQVSVFGTINALSDNARSSISLFGAQGVSVGAGAALHADGFGEKSRGGLITLGTATGMVDVADGSTISTSGSAENGHVQIRAPRVGDGVAISHLGANFVDVLQVGVEAFSSFVHNAATLTQADIDGYIQQISAPITASLAAKGSSLFITRGLDLTHTGNLSLGSIDLYGSRPNGQPVNLAVRATGSISVSRNSVISDGFVVDASDPARPRVDMQAGPSASLRFAAGSTLGSANPLAVERSFTGMTGGDADFSLATGAIIRTGTGDLGIAASRDIKYDGKASVYTAGNQGLPTDNRIDFSGNNGPSFGFATGGGQLSMVAGRNIVGAPVTRAVGDWQPRSMRTDSEETKTQWGVDVARFDWNAGSLGGGDVSLRAGGAVSNMSVAAANSGQQQADGSIAEFGGGVLSIDAVGDISSLYANVTHGTNVIRTASALGRARSTATGELLGSVLAVQDAAVDIRARSGIVLETAFNPTVISQQGAASDLKAFFYTYGEHSRLSAVSAAGDVVLKPSVGPTLVPFVGSATGNNAQLTVLPASLQLYALGGDLRVGGTGSLFASDTGQLDLLAARDIIGTGSSLIMSDQAAGDLPSVKAPSTSAPPPALIGAINGSGRHLGDTAVAQITAGRDILNEGFSVAKAVQVRAGRDIVNTSLLGQNLKPTDVTLISAGRDIRYVGDVGQTGRITLGGPGSLVVTAGRDVDLGFSKGITSVGATLNAALPSDSGADISVIAGFSAGLRADRFVAELVDDSADYKKALIAFIDKYSDGATPSYDTARSQFLLMDAPTQLAFISQVFFSELVKSGREVNADPTLGFDRGYAAIDALFPGSRPGKGDPASPYQGDILLSFSRIYSVSDGTISLFAPGGLLNVGLANPPKSVQDRPPSELGIVAQRAGDVRVFTAGDVLVNASRVFTLGGGDIAVWSTLGDIDAGRGAKSAISAPPPILTTDATGNVNVDFGAAVAGSGIRTITTRPGAKPGNVDLIAPAGIVNAGDAGIGASGNLNVAAQQVVGLDNIQVGGSSTGVPAETSNLGASLSGASSASTAASSSSSNAVEQRRDDQGPAPLADTALGWLDVFIEGFGDEVCKSSDTECLQRNRKTP